MPEKLGRRGVSSWREPSRWFPTATWCPILQAPAALLSGRSDQERAELSIWNHPSCPVSGNLFHSLVHVGTRKNQKEQKPKLFSADMRPCWRKQVQLGSKGLLAGRAWRSSHSGVSCQSLHTSDSSTKNNHLQHPELMAVGAYVFWSLCLKSPQYLKHPRVIQMTSVSAHYPWVFWWLFNFGTRLCVVCVWVTAYYQKASGV